MHFREYLKRCLEKGYFSKLFSTGKESVKDKEFYIINKLTAFFYQIKIKVIVNLTLFSFGPQTDSICVGTNGGKEFMSHDSNLIKLKTKTKNV